MEIWGGIECTINRVENNFFDQLNYSGHYERENDLEKISGLGIKKMRYPVLWEKHQPKKNEKPEWTWVEKQLEQLRFLGIEPIAGLLHHGSGPAYTNLLDNNFPALFSAYAKAVATKFPWINYYTPVNEPLTTARFSGLYGIWYPHTKNDISFVKMLLNQLKATVLAMGEIRLINPTAKFLQTEDLGKIYSTPLLQYQANFENHRRWLTHDILLGKFDYQHPLWEYFIRLGIDEEQLRFFINNPCPPDLMGVNYYVTSERFIDERINLYPEHTVGGNEVHTYADVEKVRVRSTEPSGLKLLLNEMWDRYRIPIVISEIHLHSNREDQLRWFKECFETILLCKHDGFDIRACTVWALLGSYGWNKLLTGNYFDYEPGAFDVSSGILRPTALASYMRSLQESHTNHHEILLKQNGWWKRPDRFLRKGSDSRRKKNSTSSPLIIIGKNGTLGKAFNRICHQRHLSSMLTGRENVDICYEEQIESLIQQYKPWAIINAAGYVRVDDAENDEENCYRSNTLGPQKLAIACEKKGIKFITFSSDLVFDGKSKSPYSETDETNPLNVYGKSKALAESFVTRVNPQSLVIRTSAFFSADDDYNFLSVMFSNLENGKLFHASANTFISPTYVPDLVNTTLDLLVDNEKGIWHLSNRGEISWYEFAKLACTYAEVSTEGLVPIYNKNGGALIPAYSVLKTKRGAVLPGLENAIQRYVTAKNIQKNINQIIV